MAKQFQRTMFSAVANTATTNSEAIECVDVIAISVQAVSTGTPTSVLKIQASNDSPVGKPGVSSGVFTPTNWTDIASATVSIGAAGTFLIPKTDLCYEFIRLVLTGTGGATGTTTVNIKVLGY